MKEHTVYVSGHLKNDVNKNEKYGKEVYHQLHAINEIEVVELNTNNVWCRDYMPVKTATGNYVQFKYNPFYMRGIKKYKDKFPDIGKIHEEIKLACTPSEIVLDGGAIEIHGKKGIVSDRVFRDNTNNSPADIYKKLMDELKLDHLIVIPQYPYDFTGHVDGLVRFIDEKSVVANDLKKELKQSEADENQYRKKLIENWVYAFQSALISAGLEIYELPDSVPENGSPNSGEGIYTNFLLLPDLILMPAYGNDTDDLALERLSNLYKNRKVIKVAAKELSQMGGMINCVTWTK